MREILTEGQKLKRIRTELNFPQWAIAEPYSDKYLLSFEKDDRKLSKHKKVAEVFLRNINKYAAKRKDMDHITLEYLTETVEEQANRFLAEITDLIINNTEDFESLKAEGLNLVETYSINEDAAIEFYTAAADYYFSKHEYKKEEEMLIKRYALCFDSNKSLKLFDASTKLMCNSLYQGNYAHAIRTGDTLMAMIDNGIIKDTERISKVYINKALAYKNDKNYQECVRMLDEWESRMIIPEKFEYTLKTIKSNCYVLVGRYNEALQIYLNEINEAIAKGNSVGEIANNYANVAYAYLKMHNIAKAMEYIEKALKPIYGVIDIYKMNIYYNALEVYSYIGDYEKSLMYFDLSLHAALIMKNGDKLHKILNTMFEYCIKHNLNNELFSIVETVESKAEIEKTCELLAYYHKIAAHFKKLGDNEKFFYVFDIITYTLDKDNL